MNQVADSSEACETDEKREHSADLCLFPTLSASQFLHCLQNGVRSHRFRIQSHKSVLPNLTLIPRHQRQVQVVSCASDRLALDWEVPTTLSLGLINWPEQLTELKEAFSLLDD